MKKLVEPFNEMMKEQVRKKFNDTVGYLVEQIRCNGQKDKGISLYSTTLEYQSDYLYEWRKFAWEQGNVESSVAIEFYRNNVDMFINYDAMDDYVEELADEYGVDDVALFIQGGCRIYMGNPYYEEGEDELIDVVKTDIAKNTILYGPPGTGKTYNTVLYAVAIIESKSLADVKNENYSDVLTRYNTYKADGLIEFTTFHQSYGYEEFIEGIKPVMDNTDETAVNQYTTLSFLYFRFFITPRRNFG